MPKARAFVRVQFQVEAPLGHGQTIVLTGSGPALGENDPLNGVPLYTTPAEYPRWSSDWVSVATNAELTYKYAIFEGVRFSHWEPIGTNRAGTRTVRVQEDQVVTDVLGVVPSPKAAAPPRLAEGGRGGSGSVQFAEEEAEEVEKKLEKGLRGFTFAEGEGEEGEEAEEQAERVVIDREDAEAMAGSLGDRAIDVKSITPNMMVKHVSLRLGREERQRGGGRQGVGGVGKDARSCPLGGSGSGHGSGGGASGGGKAGGQKRGRVGSGSAASAFLDPEEVAITPSDGVVVVSYFLPLIVTRAGGGSGAGGSGGGGGSSSSRGGKGAAGEDHDWIIAWDQENLLSLRTRLRVTWVGTVRLPEESGPLGRDEQESLARALRRFDCVPVFVDPEQHERFYKTFCKGTLWPVFHHILDVYGPLPTRFWDQKTQDSVWHSYSYVNMRFRDKVVEVYNEGDLIWIHGFHLLVLPSFITKSLPTAKTGLFLHTPFPSSEIFRTLSVREDLLRGMLNADHIGFHLYEYARHFVTCVRRILGVTYDMERGQMAVHYNGRTVAVSSIHVGVDNAHLRSVMAEPQVTLEAAALWAKFQGRKVVLGIDRLERIRGIPLKLLAFERLLQKHPEWRGRVVLVQVGITASERGEDYTSTKKEVASLVASINAANADLAEPPVLFMERRETEMRLLDRMPLLALADAFIVTSPRDGLNRMPLEFVAAQAATRGVGVGGSAASSRRASAVDLPAASAGEKAGAAGSGRLVSGGGGVGGGSSSPEKQGREQEGAAEPAAELPPPPGVCILSEFVSCTRVLLGAMFVNPWEIEETTALLHKALGMSREERVLRHTRDVGFVNSQTVLNWAYQILVDLKRVKKDYDRSFYSGVGLGLHYRVLGMDKGFNPLRVEDVARAYRQASHRVVMLDYGGTLVAGSEKTENVQYYAVSNKLTTRKGPSKELLSTLKDLCGDLKNSVFVVTGMERQALEAGFGGVGNLGLGAEHGFFFKMPHAHLSPPAAPASSTPTSSGQGGGGSGWEMMLPAFDSAWMELARAIMDVYVKRTHGTYIEQKGSALLWQYRDADPEFGHMQSKELEDHLSGVLRGYPVEILRGENNPMQGGYIELRPSGVHKGAFLARVLASLEEHGKAADFVLVVGDDASDEFMFTAAEDYAADKAPHPPLPPSSHHHPLPQPGQPAVYSCTVGKKPSAARAFLNDVEEVHALLSSLARCSKVLRATSRGFISSVDLRELSSSSGLGECGHEAGVAGDGLVGGPLGGGGGGMGGFRPPQLSKALSESDRRASGLRKNLSLIELGGHKRGDMGDGEGSLGGLVPEPTQSPSGAATAVSWQQYVVRISEDEEEGVFF